jgi:lipopolysaccharide/colanic/teichoic acid biosynthesis glycosyltransferase
VAAAALVLLAPVLLVIAALVRAHFDPPVLFRQQRPGKNGVPFTIVKFKTMRATTRERDTDELRLTTLGRWLRSMSLDELPEIINVLRGEMSFVGPRPLLMQYLPRYTLEQAQRHKLRPGITGWAQINGRNALSWDDKFRLDVWYVDHCSLSLDLKILALTCWKIVTREGITQPGHASTAEFMGSPHP